MPPPNIAKLTPKTPQQLTNRTLGSVQSPSASMAGAELTTEIYTYITKASDNGKSVILYNGDRQYAQVTLELETAGPVAVGNKEQVIPVLSGKGILLDTGTPYSTTISKGTRLYVAATGVNRVKVTIAPPPWLEQFAGLLGAIEAQMAYQTQVLVDAIEKLTAALGGRR